MRTQTVPLRYVQFDALTAPHFFDGFPGTITPITRVSEMDDIAAFARGDLTADVLAVFSPYLRHYTMPLDILEPIDVSRLPHWNDLLPEWQEATQFRDGGGRLLAVPNNWGTDSLIINQRVVGDASEDSIGLLFDRALAGRVAMPGQDGIESAAVAAMYLGLADPFNLSDRDLAAVRDLVMETRCNVHTYWTTERELVSLFRQGEIDVAWGWLPTYTELRRDGIPVRWGNPREGQILWADGNGIFRGTPNLDGAYAFMDYLICPQYLRPFYEKTGYRTCSRVVTATLSDMERQALNLDNPQELTSRCVTWISPPPECARATAAMWQEVWSR